MRITKASVDHFGKIKKNEIDFKEGLNIIYGENESGKSTLLAFIKAMLYGFTSNKKNIRENDRKRYMPWGEVKASGKLHLDEGKIIYRIKRNFGESKSKDKIEIINAITGENIPLEIKSTPGKQLLGIENHTYEKTSLITQLSSKINENNNDEIVKYLTNLKVTGDSSVSYHKAKKHIEEYKKSIVNSNKKPGILDKLRKEYDLKLEKLRQLHMRKNNFHEQESNDTIDFEQVLINLSEEFDRQEDIEQIKIKSIQYKDILDRLEKKDLEKEQYIQSLQDEDRTLSIDSIQAQEDLNKIIEEKIRIENYHEKINKHDDIVEELNQLRKDKTSKNLSQKIINMENTAQKMESLLKQQKELDDKFKNTFSQFQHKKNRNTMIVLSGTTFIYLILMVTIILKNLIPVSVEITMLIPLFYLLFRILKIIQDNKKSGIEKQRIKNEMIKIEKQIMKSFEKHQIKNSSQLYEKIQKNKIEYGNINTVIQEKEKLLLEYDKDYFVQLTEKSERNISKLLKKYKCKNIEDLKKKIKDHQYSKEQLLRTDEMKQIYNREKKEMSIKKQSLYQEILEEINMLFEQTSLLLNRNIDDLKKRIEIYEKEIKAIDEALNTIEDAFTKFHMSFSQVLNEKTTDILKAITLQNYDQVLISKDLDIKISHNDIKDIKHVDYFSNGTWDQIYFSVRLAIADIIREKINKRLPLLLDDAFIQYDENRLGAVLEYLYEYAKNNQVILFTCQKREANYLKKYKDVHIINIK